MESLVIVFVVFFKLNYFYEYKVFFWFVFLIVFFNVKFF